MQFHRGLRADRAGRRTTASEYRWKAALALILPLLVVGCGSDPDQAILRTPPSQQADQVLSDTIDGLAAVDDPTAGDDDEPDYTAAELELLLEGPATDVEVLDGPEPGPLESRSPEVAIEAIESEVDDATDAAGTQTPILDRVQPLDGAPTATVFGLRDGRRINEAGEPNRLDEPAALACGNVEIALTALDGGRPDDAADHLRRASTLAAESAVTAMGPWSPVLDQAATDTATPSNSTISNGTISNGTISNGTISNGTISNGTASSLLAFLNACTQGGYEL